MLIPFPIDIMHYEIDNLLAETSAYLNILHPDYGKLAARVAVTQLYRETSDQFMDVINTLYYYKEANGKTYHSLKSL
jgi:ribonucleoside-diphosphate reductase subunit M1